MKHGKLWIFAVTVIIMIAVFAGTAMAATIGTCGDNLTWTLDENGVLTISGSGEMYDYYDDSPPWYDIYDSIKAVEIGNGVTSIGVDAFADCSSLTKVYIPKSVTGIGEWAFAECSNLKDVYYSGTEAQWNKITIAAHNDYLTSATLHPESYTGSVFGEPTVWIPVTGGAILIAAAVAAFVYRKRKLGK